MQVIYKVEIGLIIWMTNQHKTEVYTSRLNNHIDPDFFFFKLPH